MHKCSIVIGFMRLHNRERPLTWTFRAVLALLWGAVVSWLAFSLFAVAGFSLVLCLGYIDCGQWKRKGGRKRVSDTASDKKIVC